MNEFKEITDRLVKFRDSRNWEQFHNSKDLALAISIEAAELNELFLWKQGREVSEVKPERIAEELADILSFSFLLAEKHGFDVRQIVLDKIEQNELKYPVDKSRGSARKYNELP